MKQSLSHTVWECKYHVVFVPKRRRKVLYGQLGQEVGSILGKLCRYKGIEVIEGKVCGDHVHACLAIPPKYSVSNIMGYLKGKSTMIIMEKHGGFGKNFRGQQFWARGYYVNTVGLNEARVKKYIQDQEKNEMAEERYGQEADTPREERKYNEWQ